MIERATLGRAAAGPRALSTSWAMRSSAHSLKARSCPGWSKWSALAPTRSWRLSAVGSGGRSRKIQRSRKRAARSASSGRGWRTTSATSDGSAVRAAAGGRRGRGQRARRHVSPGSPRACQGLVQLVPQRNQAGVNHRARAGEDVPVVHAWGEHSDLAGEPRRCGPVAEGDRRQPEAGECSLTGCLQGVVAEEERP